MSTTWNGGHCGCARVTRVVSRYRSAITVAGSRFVSPGRRQRQQVNGPNAAPVRSRSPPAAGQFRHLGADADVPPGQLIASRIRWWNFPVTYPMVTYPTFAGDGLRLASGVRPCPPGQGLAQLPARLRISEIPPPVHPADLKRTTPPTDKLPRPHATRLH